MPGVTQTIPITTPDTPPPSSPRLFGRIRGLFTGRRSEPRETKVITTSAKTDLGKPVSGTVVSHPTNAPTVPAENALSEKDLEKAGHEKDYSWITGRVFRASGGQWVLRYAGPHEVDTYGGSVLLTPKPGMPTLLEGDLICVHGKVSGRSGRGVIYDATEINVVEHKHR